MEKPNFFKSVQTAADFCSEVKLCRIISKISLKKVEFILENIKQILSVVII